MRTIGIDFDKNIEICDAFEKTIKGERKMVIDLYAM
jgi:hypothetical protein